MGLLTDVLQGNRDYQGRAPAGRRSRLPAAAALAAAFLSAWLCLPAAAAGPGQDGEQREKTLSGKRFSDVLGQELHVEASWTGDALADAAGGEHRGLQWVSLLHLGAALDGDVLGLSPNGRMLLSAVQISTGEAPAATAVGDVQGVSNNAAPNATRVYQFWYWQALPPLHAAVRGGLIDMNQYFAVIESGGTLINSSFGLSPGLSANAAVSTYPEPGYGATLDLSFGKRAGTLGLGVFQGDPTRRSSVFSAGRYAVGEWDSPAPADDAVPAVLKLGAWDCRCSSGSPIEALHTWGEYAIAQVSLGERSGAPLAIFGQVALSQSADSVTPAAYALGVSVPVPFPSRPYDIFSAGATRQTLRHLPSETAYEATYLIGFSDAFSVQPDVQYVANPGGHYPNAWVFILRFHIDLESGES